MYTNYAVGKNCLLIVVIISLTVGIGFKSSFSTLSSYGIDFFFPARLYTIYVISNWPHLLERLRGTYGATTEIALPVLVVMTLCRKFNL